MRTHRNQVVVMDTHAGVEHFGRSLARGFDTVVVVVEPTYNSVQVGVDTARLAEDLGIPRAHLVVNRVRRDADTHRALDLAERLGAPTFASVHTIPFDEQVPDTEPSVEGLLAGSVMVDAARRLADGLLAIDSSLEELAR